MQQYKLHEGLMVNYPGAHPTDDISIEFKI